MERPTEINHIPSSRTSKLWRKTFRTCDDSLRGVHDLHVPFSIGEERMGNITSAEGSILRVGWRPDVDLGVGLELPYEIVSLLIPPNAVTMMESFEVKGYEQIAEPITLRSC